MPKSAASSRLNPATLISRSRKEKHLAQLSEAVFRDNVVLAIFERRGLKLLRDTCGPTEEGKDSLFLDTDPLGHPTLYAVQTKKGAINLSRKPAENLETAVTQLRTALATSVVVHRTKMQPLKVVLCASGKINDAARRHIHDTLTDPRLVFYDVNDVINDLDMLYPEYWYGIDADRFPYLRTLKEELLQASDTIAISELGVEQGYYAPITDDSYVMLCAVRITSESHKVRGQVTEKPKLDQRSVTTLINGPDKLILLTGEGGSGKTTALRRIAYCLSEVALQSDKPHPLPVFLKASEAAKIDARLVETAAAATAKLSPERRPAFGTEDLMTGRVTILIDGLDEVLPEQHREKVVGRIVEFSVQNPQCQVILSSRDYDFLRRIRALDGFSRYNLIHIELQQAMKIVERVAQGRSIPKEQASEMLRRLQDVHGLGLSPLLVTIFVATTDFAKTDIPPNITELFKKFTELMLGRWDQRKGFAQQYEVLIKDFLLQKLALIMHTRRQARLSLDEVRSIIADELQRRGHTAKLDTLFDETVRRASLLRVDGEDVSFRHHLLQEFYAGRGAGVEQFRVVVHDEWWRNPIIFHFGDRPSRVQDLTPLMDTVAGLQPAEAYHAAVTIGLALQACYLAEVVDKDSTLLWVITALAQSYKPFIEAATVAKMPLHAFLLYYISGRDAVASNRIQHLRATIEAEYKAHPNEFNEKRMFWTIVGLMESGYVDVAEDLVRKFQPSDPRLLLAIDLGCVFISHLRISTPDQRKCADRILGRIRPKVQFLIAGVIEEMKSLLLEFRRGAMMAIESPRDLDSGCAGEGTGEAKRQ